MRWSLRFDGATALAQKPISVPAAHYRADVPHSIRAVGNEEAVVFLVVTYNDITNLFGL